MAQTPGVTAILAPNPSVMTGAGTTSYVVGDALGCVVIDPGPDDPGHLGRIIEAARSHHDLAAILITHGHPDHDEGAARLRALTGAPILAWSREGVSSATALLADGDAVACGGRTLLALHTPGHRFDHLCFLLPEEGTLFAGDLVAGSGTVVIAPPEGDLAAYLASLRRVAGLPLRRILPAHGPAIDRPGEVLAATIRHRLEREAQVLAALAAGMGTVAEMVERIYRDVDPALHALAALTVTAHLLKLEREGRVACTEAVYALTPGRYPEVAPSDTGHI